MLPVHDNHVTLSCDPQDVVVSTTHGQLYSGKRFTGKVSTYVSVSKAV